MDRFDRKTVEVELISCVVNTVARCPARGGDPDWGATRRPALPRVVGMSTAAISAPTVDLALFALDHAIDAVLASRTPLIPLVLTETGIDRTLRRIAAGRIEECVAMALAVAASDPDVDRVAVAWDGYAELPAVPAFGGGRVDAILVRVFEAGADESHLFAQGYRLGGVFTRGTRVGMPARLGADGPLF